MSENALSVSQDWRSKLEKRRASLVSRAPKDWPVGRLVDLIHQQYMENEKLQRCSQASIIGAMYQLADLGLYPGGALGQAYIIPFGSRAQLVLGYKGLVSLALRSGRVSTITGNVAFTADTEPPARFDFDEAEGWVRHRKSLGDDRGEPIAAYAVARLQGGHTVCRVLTVAEVNAIRDKSQGYRTALKYNKTDHPWMVYWDQMAAKTAIRNLSKVLPLTADEKWNRAAELDQQATLGIDQGLDRVIQVEAEPVPDTPKEPDELDDIIDATQGNES